MSDASGSFLFLYGADMEPEAVRATYPGARFVARAWVRAAAAELPPLPATEPPPPLPGAARSPEDAVWGILLRLAVPDFDGTAGAAPVGVEATADDERRFTATIGTDAAALANPTAVLDAARYWELPPSYVRRLAAWAEASGTAS